MASGLRRRLHFATTSAWLSGLFAGTPLDPVVRSVVLMGVIAFYAAALGFSTMGFFAMALLEKGVRTPGAPFPVPYDLPADLHSSLDFDRDRAFDCDLTAGMTGGRLDASLMPDAFGYL
jgi:hypothetical protein